MWIYIDRYLIVSNNILVAFREKCTIVIETIGDGYFKHIFSSEEKAKEVMRNLMSAIKSGEKIFIVEE